MPKENQEWDVFYALCPQSLLDIMDDPGLTFANRTRLFLRCPAWVFTPLRIAAAASRFPLIPFPASAGKQILTISICRTTPTITKNRLFRCS